MADHSKTAEHKATIIYQENYNGCSEQREGEREGVGRVHSATNLSTKSLYPFHLVDMTRTKANTAMERAILKACINILSLYVIDQANNVW